MRRRCDKHGPAAPHGRSRACFHWRVPTCQPQRRRTRFTPPFRSDLCLGGRGLRCEAARPGLGA
jgi:hypothetical protein